ncbi:MAG: EamA family transporter, partial [Xanthomonadales bacterium]|nr:EamA family transporter [Xanthomonadales bacterium]
RSSQLSMLGPVSLLFLGHWILGERISLIQLIGTAVVLAGIAVLTSPARRIDADQVGTR